MSSGGEDDPDGDGKPADQPSVYAARNQVRARFGAHCANLLPLAIGSNALADTAKGEAFVRTRLGGLLIAALGAVLITSGFTSSPTLNVGASPVSCTDEVAETVGGPPICPEGTIIFNEQDKVLEGTPPSSTPTPTPTATASEGARPALARHALAQPLAEPTSPEQPPSAWTVTISSSNCDLPSGTATTYQVPDGSSKTTGPLELFDDTASDHACQYSYVETAVTNWTASYDPAAPQAIPLNNNNPGASHLNVALLNTAYWLPATQPTKSSSPAPSATPTHKTTVKATVKATHRVKPSPSTLPLTGGSHLGVTAWIGGLLVLIGIWLTVTPSIARRRRPGKHS